MGDKLIPQSLVAGVKGTASISWTGQVSNKILHRKKSNVDNGTGLLQVVGKMR